MHLARTRTSITSSASRRDPDFEVTLDEAENPETGGRPLWYRAYTVLSVSFATWVVVLYSTSYTATIEGIMEEFDVSSRSVATLGLTTYLLGLAVGAVFGAAMISNSPGTVVDIAGHESLALCMSWYSIAPLNGPVTGPLIGGFVYENLGWRWGNWIAMILAGVAVCMLAMVKETYAPTLLKTKAAKMRKKTGDERWWCRYDEQISTVDLLRINLSRPFVLAATEPILWFFNIWISIIYGILYLCFIAYPIIFTQHRGWSISHTGLSFIGIGVGTLLAIALEPLWRRLIHLSPK
ncbi:hypothetical protein N0V88_005626 [Collariella sp. IMI 366227]|nr:hypothetical protein N0V88_005626 [Collariella sp. IMI 366227]